MALSQATNQLWGRSTSYFCSSVADLPTTYSGIAFQVGDQAWNITPTIGQPSYWEVSAVSPTAVTWINGPILGSQASRTVTLGTTLLATDSTVVVNDASASVFALPTASTMPQFTPFFIVNIGAGTTTLTPATGTINGASTLAVLTNTAVEIVAISATAWVTR
jgi:hypothetical protein